MARITTVQAQLRGPINRDENLVAHSWFVTLVVGAIIGGIALLLWMFQAGAWSERTWPSASISPAAYSGRRVTRSINVVVPNVTASRPSPAPSRDLTPEEKAEQFKEELRRQYGVH